MAPPATPPTPGTRRRPRRRQRRRRPRRSRTRGSAGSNHPGAGVGRRRLRRVARRSARRLCSPSPPGPMDDLVAPRRGRRHRAPAGGRSGRAARRLADPGPAVASARPGAERSHRPGRVSDGSGRGGRGRCRGSAVRGAPGRGLPRRRCAGGRRRCHRRGPSSVRSTSHECWWTASRSSCRRWATSPPMPAGTGGRTGDRRGPRRPQRRGRRRARCAARDRPRARRPDRRAPRGRTVHERRRARRRCRHRPDPARPPPRPGPRVTRHRTAPVDSDRLRAVERLAAPVDDGHLFATASPPGDDAGPPPASSHGVRPVPDLGSPPTHIDSPTPAPDHGLTPTPACPATSPDLGPPADDSDPPRTIDVRLLPAAVASWLAALAVVRVPAAAALAVGLAVLGVAIAGLGCVARRGARPGPLHEPRGAIALVPTLCLALAAGAIVLCAGSGQTAARARGLPARARPARAGRPCRRRGRRGADRPPARLARRPGTCPVRHRRRRRLRTRALVGCRGSGARARSGELGGSTVRRAGLGDRERAPGRTREPGRGGAPDRRRAGRRRTAAAVAGVRLEPARRRARRSPRRCRATLARCCRE